MEEMLIYFVRGNRMLWDPSHPSFSKLAMKKRRVEDIAALLRREVGPEEAFAVTAGELSGLGVHIYFYLFFFNVYLGPVLPKATHRDRA